MMCNEKLTCMWCLPIKVNKKLNIANLERLIQRGLKMSLFNALFNDNGL